MGELTKTLSALYEGHQGINLSPADLCFVVALRAKADQSSLTAFDEEALADVFQQVMGLLEPEAESLKLRATTAIRRLREQRLLTRIDGAGVMRAGEYALTRLSDALAEFFLQEETLTRESLVLLTQTLTSQLLQVKKAAGRAKTAEDWRRDVVQPLRITAGDLLGGIERRQRGLDASQEKIREQIATLLRDDWFQAIEACEALLEETAATLRELNDILLRDAASLQTQLQDIAELGRERGDGGESAALQLAEQVDRVAAWGASRQRAWSDYYRYVQRFLRDVVRLDPGRALSQRLRDQLRGFCDRRFHLVAADMPALPVPRVPDLRAERPMVVRRRVTRELDMEAVVADDGIFVIEARTRELLAQRPASLATIVRELVGAVPPEERFRLVGRLTALCGVDTQVQRTHERPWTPVGAGIELEDWAFLWPRESPSGERDERGATKTPKTRGRRKA